MFTGINLRKRFNSRHVKGRNSEEKFAVTSSKVIWKITCRISWEFPLTEVKKIFCGRKGYKQHQRSSRRQSIIEQCAYKYIILLSFYSIYFFFMIVTVHRIYNRWLLKKTLIQIIYLAIIKINIYTNLIIINWIFIWVRSFNFC